MSEDGFSDSFEEPNIEIQIKTLLGTTFHIKVSPNDTVSDIKKKIYRVEGKIFVIVINYSILFHIELLKLLILFIKLHFDLENYDCLKQFYKFFILSKCSLYRLQELNKSISTVYYLMMESSNV